MAKQTPNGMIWARMEGFPFWPARVCSSIERTFLAARNPGPKYDDRVAIMFLGNVRQSGWVKSSLVIPFAPESLPLHPTIPVTPDTDTPYFTAKQFKKDRDFRAAVLEAVRVSEAQGIKFSPELIELISTADKDVDWVRDDLCSECKGSELSGVSLVCEKCEKFEIHFHCLKPPLLIAPEGSWYCPDCCKKLKIDYNAQIPDGEEVQIQKQLDSLTKVRNKKRKLSVAGSPSLIAATLGTAIGIQDGAAVSEVDGEGGIPAASSLIMSSQSAPSSNRNGRGGSGNPNRSNARSRSGSSNVNAESFDIGNGFPSRGPPSRAGSGALTDGQRRHSRDYVPSYDGYDQGVANDYDNDPTYRPASAKKPTFRRVRAPTPRNSSDLVSERIRHFAEGWQSRSDSANNLGAVSDLVGTPSNVNPCVRLEDDVCLVCKDGGKLVLCDYPQCTRTYHQVCIAKHFTVSPESIPMDDGFPDDLWFCPVHRCAVCDTFQAGAFAPHQLPSVMVREWTNCGSAGIAQKPLKFCPTCPQSLCLDCDASAQLLLKQNGYRPRRLAEKETGSLCINCLYPQPIVRLNRVLEKALLRGLRSRLAVPFLRPLLPIIGVPDSSSSARNSDKAGSNLPPNRLLPFLLEKPVPQFIVSTFFPEFWAEGDRQNNCFLDALPADNGDNHQTVLEYLSNLSFESRDPQDLFGLLENIRTLKYSSTEEFLIDLNIVMAKCLQKIAASQLVLGIPCTVRKIRKEVFSTEESLSYSLEYDQSMQKLMNALETVVVLSITYLYDRREELQTIQDQLATGGASVSRRQDSAKSYFKDSFGSITKEAPRAEVLKSLQSLFGTEGSPTELHGKVNVQVAPELVVSSLDGVEEIDVNCTSHVDTNTEAVGNSSNAEQSNLYQELVPPTSPSASFAVKTTSPSLSLVSSWRRLTSLTSCSLQALTTSSLSLFSGDNSGDVGGEATVIGDVTTSMDVVKEIKAEVPVSVAQEEVTVPLITRMWRLECERNIDGTTSQSPEVNAVLPKSFLGWIAFMDDGALAHSVINGKDCSFRSNHIYGYPVDVRELGRHNSHLYGRNFIDGIYHGAGLQYGSGGWTRLGLSRDEYISEWVRQSSEARKPEVLTRELIGDILLSMKDPSKESRLIGSEANDQSTLSTDKALPATSSTHQLAVDQKLEFLEFDAGESKGLHPDALRGESVSLMETTADTSEFGAWSHGIAHAVSAATAVSVARSDDIDELAVVDDMWSGELADEYLIKDESLILLDRIREFTTKTLLMENRLRREYVELKRSKIRIGTEPLSLGEAHILQEMKLANDQLRWNLQQKQLALDAAAKTIEDLRSGLRQQDSQDTYRV